MKWDALTRIYAVDRSAEVANKLLAICDRYNEQTEATTIPRTDGVPLPPGTPVDLWGNLEHADNLSDLLDAAKALEDTVGIEKVTAELKRRAHQTRNRF
ncbi:MAG: hypothetical protein HRT64_12345 [Erythrobacter sp.]|nr:hypothetical protein [Erythrobacter sp.]